MTPNFFRCLLLILKFHDVQRKNSNVKTIPPYKPVSVNNSGSDESPEKKLSNFNQIATDSKQTAKRKTVGSRPATANGTLITFLHLKFITYEN